MKNGTYFRIDEKEEPADLPNYSFGENDFDGYWLYDNGYVLQIGDGEWYLYDDGGKMFQHGPIEYEGSEAWLMNEDGSSGGGYLQFDEEGNLVESEKILTRLEEFPYGNSENE